MYTSMVYVEFKVIVIPSKIVASKMFSVKTESWESTDPGLLPWDNKPPFSGRLLVSTSSNNITFQTHTYSQTAAPGLIIQISDVHNPRRSGWFLLSEYICRLQPENYVHCSRFIMMTSSKRKHFPRDWPFLQGIHRWIPRTKAIEAPE